MAGKPKHPVIDGRKQCSRCERILPFNREHFVEAPDKKTGGRRLFAHCRQCAREAWKQYRSTDHGKKVRRERSKTRRLEDPVFLEKCRDINKSSARKRRKEDPEAVREYSRKWYQENREKFRVWSLSSSRRRRGAAGAFNLSDIEALYARQSGKCLYCSCSLESSFHIDHMLPLSRGGTNWPSNLALACPTCNLRKGAKTPEEFLRTEAA